MRLVDKLYDWLLVGPAPDCDRMLSQALPTAEPEWAERIIEVLLARRCDSSWRGLLEHYQDLSPEVQEKIRADGRLLREGLSLVLRGGGSATRLHALAAVRDDPPPSLMYLLTDTLRDADHEVRTAAAQAITRCAENVLAAEARLEQEAVSDEQAEAVRVDRAHLVRALAEALHTFDRHRRVDVLETCLWFTRDLADEIWELLDTPRSHANVLAAERFRTWNSPRLAAFLLSALKHPTWRRDALQILQGWDTAEHCRVLFRESRFLDDPEIRRRLSGLQAPRWATLLTPDLEDVPPALRPRAPHWVLHLGIEPFEKIDRLTAWVRTTDEALHRAAVYALAELNDPDIMRRLERISASESPLARFCAWYVRARKMELVRTRHERSARTQPEPEEAPSSDVDFALLWQVCRRTEPNLRGELIDVIRENAGVWRTRIRNNFRSPDPRDRILALQIVSTQELALRFRQSLRELDKDPVTGIRNLAETLVKSISNRPEDRLEESPPPVLDEDSAERADLHALLNRMVTGQEDATSPEVISDLRAMLQHVYGEVGSV